MIPTWQAAQARSSNRAPQARPALASAAAPRPPAFSRSLQLSHITQRQDSVEGSNPGTVSESPPPQSGREKDSSPCRALASHERAT
jgi:hypothetical protein